jgi:O-antigen biosynthesis protein
MKLPSILSEPEASPLFWRPSRLAPSAWFGHIPFAFWLVTQIRPAVLVELGTLWGTSYAAFCDAVVRGGLATRCFAVDTWVGDQHTGYYGEQVFADFRPFHDQHYQAFSTLLRMTFDAAREQVPDGAVDLLHIDGDHTYEAVRHDFETWRPKLSERAVVLFHDTNVRERDFGVWRLWHELRRQHPGFEFFHSYGLGVLAPGAEVPAALAALFQADDVAAAAIRSRFAFLGGAIEADAQARQAGEELARLNDEAARRDAEFTSRLDAAEKERVELLEQLRLAKVEVEREQTERLAQLEQAKREQRELSARLSRAQTELKSTAQDRDALTAAHAQARALIAKLREEQSIILGSTSWRLTWPLRRFGQAIPAPVRRIPRRAVNAAASLRRSLRAPPPVAPAATAEVSSRSAIPRGAGRRRTWSCFPFSSAVKDP